MIVNINTNISNISNIITRVLFRSLFSTLNGAYCVGGNLCKYTYVYIYIYIYTHTYPYIYIYIHVSYDLLRLGWLCCLTTYGLNNTVSIFENANPGYPSWLGFSNQVYAHLKSRPHVRLSIVSRSSTSLLLQY